MLAKHGQPELDEEGGDGVLAVEETSADDGNIPGIVPVVPPPLQLERPWVRCIVSDGSRGEMKLYIAIGLVSLEQRRFVHCPEHSCRRYRPINSYASREALAAEMYEWFHARCLEQCSTMEAHIGYQPCEAAVDATLATITLVDF